MGEWTPISRRCTANCCRWPESSRHAEVDGSDLVQEALTRTLARNPDLDGIADPAAYLRAAVVDAARSWGTRASRRARVEVPSEESHVESDPDGSVDILLRLPPRQRACLYLRFVEDLGVDEVAATARVFDRHGQVADRQGVDDVAAPPRK